MTRLPRTRARARLSRADLAAGGGALVRLVHSLLPGFDSGLHDGEGLALTPAMRPPSALPEGLPPAVRAAYAVRLLAFLAFLRSRGLGVAASDVARLGAARGIPDRPALGALPVPAWRAVSPALATAAAAVRLAGGDIRGGDDAAALREAIARALESGLDRDSSAMAASGLAADDARRPEETLLREIARGAALPDGYGAELLGLVLPSSFLGLDESSDAPVVASGAAALFVARGAARRRPEETGFLEAVPGPALAAGSVLARIADSLGSDPRSNWLRELARGAAVRRAPTGPPISLLAHDVERWDPRSRTVIRERLAGEAGFRLFEVLARPPAPWERGAALAPGLGPGEVAGLFWLPFPSHGHAVAAWELVARQARGNPERFLTAVRRLAAVFRLDEPYRGSVVPVSRAVRGVREPVVLAAALLGDGFGAAEAAAASGIPLAEAEAALAAAEDQGLLGRGARGTFSFADESERVRLAARIRATGRRETLARLAAAGVEGDRLAVAALTAGGAPALAAARARFTRASRANDLAAGATLLRRAPAVDPDLGDPAFAAAVWKEAGADARATDAARRASLARIVEPRGRGELLARLLARAGDTAGALRFLPDDGTPEASLARARLFLGAHRDAEAASILDGLPFGDGRPLEAGTRLRADLLRAELASRRGDAAAAATFLEAARKRIAALEDDEAATEAAFIAGTLASELGDGARASALFSVARERASDPARRADAILDLGVCALRHRRLAEAERGIEEALAQYASLGERDRYLSALGNRADLGLERGDIPAARADLARVLGHDRTPGRERPLLFALETAQRIALLEGDLEGAAEAFREAEGTGPVFDAHPAKRELLTNEGARLLAAGEPRSAREILRVAARIPDPRAVSEPSRGRLEASAAIDLGETPPPARPGEQALRGAERRLRDGASIPASALDELERLARGARPAEAALRVFEWTGRFPGIAALPGGLLALDLGIAAARRAGLASLAARLEALRAVPGAPPASPPARARARDRDGASAAVVAVDASTRRSLEIVARLAPTLIPVLVLGESGTGKEVIARELHRLSGRRGRFVAVNAAALPANLVESELFGHARGAFTGADRDRPGLFEEASGGTLFLDEIGDLPLPAQAKLLRVLEEKEIRRVGETKSRAVDLRLVAATHRDLDALAAQKLFRSDLTYRLARAVVTLAPLRERPGDLAAFLETALAGRTLSPEARRMVFSHGWPGNVRELLSAIELAGALAAPERRILPEHLPEGLRRAAADSAEEPETTWKDAIDGAKLRAIRKALAATGDNRTRAAERLGIARQSLVFEMRRLGIGRSRDR